VNSLLKVQMQHLHDARTEAPIGFQTIFYINAIRRRARLGNNIRRVTEGSRGA